MQAEAAAPQVDLFCRVVDNFGDAGVAYRLARILAIEHDLRVRLFIDDASVLDVIAPSADRPSAISVRNWDHAAAAQPAPLVLGTFSCRLPEAYLAKMAAQTPPPIWINVEYLSAEDWVETHHTLPSKQPNSSLTEHFFFPGFTSATGGLLREQDAITRMQQARAHDDGSKRPLKISLFCYPTPSIYGLIEGLNWTADRPVEIIVPVGKATQFLNLSAPRREGNVELVPIPMTSQAAYDALLARCDFNVVRGEDSFVRAQWAARPFLWHIYPQREDVHRVKLEAFLARQKEVVPAAQKTTLLLEKIFELTRAWNADDAARTASAWVAVAEDLGQIESIMETWRMALVQQTDLATQLIEFARSIERARKIGLQ